jgi:N-acetylglucosamine kinase-like BadF-type ATPase
MSRVKHDAPAATPTWVLGVDGGGTKTCAALAQIDETGQMSVLGRGLSGPANPRATSLRVAQHQILLAIEAAFAAAHQPPTPVAAIGLGLAGTGHPATRSAMEEWCAQLPLAPRCRVVHDAEIILRAGSSTGVGIALISGTGSLAYGSDVQGVTARAGGWGHLWGDEGSAYAIGVAALRAVAQAADRRGAPTQLVELLLRHAGADSPSDLVPIFHPGPDARRLIAALAPVVFQTAEKGDPVARRIIAGAAEDLSQMVRSVVQALAFESGAYALVCAGGVLIQQKALRESVVTRLTELALPPGSIHLAADPVLGALRLAADLLTSPLGV